MNRIKYVHVDGDAIVPPAIVIVTQKTFHGRARRPRKYPAEADRDMLRLGFVRQNR